MAKYYIHTSKDQHGDNEVHVESCSYMPDAKNREYVGDFSNCQDAVRAAKARYPNADGCYWCSGACHNH